MKLSYERLAIAGLSAMITTLLITTTARHATEHTRRPVADAPAVSTTGCTQTLSDEINAAIYQELLRHRSLTIKVKGS